MYSVYTYLQTIFFVVFWSLLPFARVYAQSTGPNPIELTVKGDKPIIHYGQRDYFFADGNLGFVWLVTNGLIWSFSFDSLRFTTWPDVYLEDMELQMGFDRGAKRFLFWSLGVGKVYTWQPGDSTLRRIDRSSNHRTQFDHSWFIHPQSSDIYAFGGYGFWESRGYTTRYEQLSREWNIHTN